MTNLRYRAILSSSYYMKEKQNAPKLSIIVPVYNVEKWLRRCLASILAQALTDWKCICVDDGCAVILDEFAAKDARFVVIHQQNGGADGRLRA